MKELENIYLDHGRNGSKHWIAQRLSAILLTPLSLWLIADGSNYIYKEYSTAVQWISKPFIATLLGATLTLFLFH